MIFFNSGEPVFIFPYGVQTPIPLRLAKLYAVRLTQGPGRNGAEAGKPRCDYAATEDKGLNATR
jgi:hypothetical protein